MRPIRFTALALSDIVFPPLCPICMIRLRALLPESETPCLGPCCWACEEMTREERGAPACERCGEPAGPYTGRRNGCELCESQRLPFSRFVRVASDGGVIGRMLRAFKFRAMHSLEPVLVAFLAEAVGRLAVDGVDGVTWVPTHWTRRVVAGHYPAERLAVGLSRFLGLPLVRSLSRVRGGPRQRGLPMHQRKRNVMRVFTLRKGCSVNHRRLLLVDDVATTGSTLMACARLLGCGGVKEVIPAVVIRVPTPSQP